MPARVAEFDLAILGGGCAGLALAARLAAARAGAPRTAVIEGRSQYTHDRTWCFWARRRHPMAELVVKHWDRWRFGRAAAPGRPRQAPGYSYQSIPSLYYYRRLQEHIERSRRVRLELGTRVLDVRDDVASAVVETDQGPVRARSVVDTRPPTDPAPLLWQVFAGAEIEAVGTPFNSRCAGIMDAMQCDDAGFRFTYLLPFSSSRALVQETRFCAQPPPLDRLRRDLDQALERVTLGGAFTRLRREDGAIPMGMRADTIADGLGACGGTRGGAVRAATGYAFLRIQSWAERCATSLAAGRPALSQPLDPWWQARMDALFLRVLRARPELAPRLFDALAQRLPPAALVRFLSDEARAVDVARVIAALPKAPFLRELVAPSFA